MANDNIIFGINPIQHLLTHSADKILEISVSASKTDNRVQAIIDQAKQHDIAVQRIDVKKLDQMFNDQNHQGIIAKIKPTAILTESALKELVNSTSRPLFLILDGVQDPHNFGACLRTADAAGVTAVIIPRDNAVGITPVVRKVASGAADTIPIVQVSNLARAMRDLQELGVWIVGTAADCEQSIYEQDFTGASAIVLGAEGTGMRQLTAKHCDFLANLPMLGQIESLNVSVAAGICLYEAVRQRMGKD
ncbi:MAG TPA: 23S rRNA (guanosine(2251)-2'-O)-methyltransferase RlmB [Gammaproteobacteria bacterium]|nr:23S rRNA (guanosine(2251)-2'-O)-methyltransferase RlmB [Gammaproteobacteria bacterium]